MLKELQLVADSPDSLKRNRGRRGLDILQKVQKMSGLDVMISDIDFPEVREVDLKLIELARTLQGKIVTNDFNLNKVAQLRGVQVLNINELANALKPVVLPGEFMKVFILKEGKEYNQGVAYLDDGTMVVVDNARRMISKNIDIVVTSVLQTTAGKMIFGRYIEGPGAQPVLGQVAVPAGERGAGRRAVNWRGEQGPAEREVIPPYHWWRTVFFLIPAIGVYTIVLGTISILSSLVDPSGDFGHRCARAWAWLILQTTGVRVTVRGLERLERDRSYVFASNHQSIYDIPIVFASLPLQLRIVAKASLGSFPFLGWHLRRTGHLLVDRKNPGAGIVKKMARLVGGARSLIVFPEGTRSADGRVGRFKGGMFLVAIDAGLPVVPVSIAGSRHVMLKGRLMTCPGDVTVTIHDPIPTAGVGREGARATRRTRARCRPAGTSEPDRRLRYNEPFGRLSANSSPMRVTAIIAAGGSGRRLGAAVPKQLLEIGGRTLLERSSMPSGPIRRSASVIVAVPADLLAAPPRWLDGCATCGSWRAASAGRIRSRTRLRRWARTPTSCWCTTPRGRLSPTRSSRGRSRAPWRTARRSSRFRSAIR